MPGTTPPAHRERLTAPVRWWLLGLAFVGSLWLAVAVAAPPVVAGAVGLVGVGALAGLLLTYGAPLVAVGNGMLRAGRAQIEGQYLGEVEVLDADAARRTAGPEADARAYLLIRPYVRRAVRVRIDDPADPAPYWLVSSRRPEQLAAAVEALRTGPRAG